MGWSRLVFILGLFIISLPQAYATHIVGGDLTYECLGNGDYEVTLTVRRDCENGVEPFDTIAYVGIYDGFGNLLPFFGTGGTIQMTNPTITTIDTDLDSGCGFIGDPVCVTEAVYKGIVNLPVRNTGYYFVYQRCCRNVTLDNIIDPLEVGSTYSIRLLENTMEECNSAPVFNDWPDVYICTDMTLTFDMSATDPEGDSLVYSLCPPQDGASFDNPYPAPPSGPPFDLVEYKPPFTFDNPFPADVPLSIDPQTGLLTSVPNTVGQWLVGVCVQEYRNGELVTTVIRDFEYNTRICTAGPMASFEVPNPFCDGLEVEVENTSTNADSYNWTVSPADNVVFNASDENPTFVFPQDGLYTITLEAIRDLDGCSNTATEILGVYNSELIASFDAAIESCQNDSTVLVLTSTSSDPTYDIISNEWTISGGGFNTTVEGQSVTVIVPTIDDLSVTLITTSENGCTSEVTEIVDADPLDFELVANPMMVCQGDTIEIIIDPNCDLTYSITPLDYVILDDPDDPCVISIAPLENITYMVTASDGSCTITKELTADVIEKADLSISGDSLFCDGIANLTVDGGLEGNQFLWSTDPNFNTIIGDMTENLEYEMVDDIEVIYVEVKEGTGCSNVASYEIINGSLDLTYPSSFTACTDSNEEIEIVNNNPNQDVSYEFEDNDIITAVTDSSVIIVVTDPEFTTQIIFTATNQYGCSIMDTIDIDAEQKPDISFTSEITCGSFEVCFTNTTTPDNQTYMWDFGDESTDEDVSNEANPCYTYPGPGSYEVTLTIDEGPCMGEGITQTVEVGEIPEIEIESEDIEICFGETVEISATTNGDADQVVWTSGDGEVLQEGGLTISITGDETFDLIVTLTDEFGCEDSDMITIEVYQFDLTIDGPEIACVDEEVMLTLTNNSEGDNFSYDWEPTDCILSGEGTTEVIVSAETTKEISVIVTNLDNGCIDTSTFVLNISEINKTIVPDDPNPFQCQEIILTVEPEDDMCEYEWASGETTVSISDTIVETTTYTVTITDENGCTLEQSLTIEPQLPQCDETDVYLPNAFSPNGDGVNDAFQVRSNFVKSMDLRVYDRWGEEVFVSTDINNGWDGTFKGANLSPNVYAFCLIATCSNGAEYKKVGNVTLIR